MQWIVYYPDQSFSAFSYSVVDMNDITSKLVREQNGNSTENLGKKIAPGQCELKNGKIVQY